MSNHSFATREARHFLMNDQEIQQVSRCYKCGGHHINGGHDPAANVSGVRIFVFTLLAALALYGSMFLAR